MDGFAGKAFKGCESESSQLGVGTGGIASWGAIEGHDIDLSGITGVLVGLDREAPTRQARIRSDLGDCQVSWSSEG